VSGSVRLNKLLNTGKSVGDKRGLGYIENGSSSEATDIVFIPARNSTSTLSDRTSHVVPPPKNVPICYYCRVKGSY